MASNLDLGIHNVTTVAEGGGTLKWRWSKCQATTCDNPSSSPWKATSSLRSASPEGPERSQVP